MNAARVFVVVVTVESVELKRSKTRLSFLQSSFAQTIASVMYPGEPCSQPSAQIVSIFLWYRRLSITWA
jgi:hypothetical protein